ncbi:High affinity cAMP-specific 3',5'-cyclic phosphodiesterase 7A, partial [Irineochytrium annulatum]
MRHKHARFSKFTLSFLDNQVEEDYRTYFWTRSVTRWRCFVAIAGFLVAAFQIASLLGKGGDGITESASATDWVIVALVALVPMLGIALISYLVSPQRMARWIHYISFLFLLVIGPILTCIRYVHFSSTSSPPHAVNPSVTAPIYIVCLVSSVFFLRLRFVHALLATAVAAPTWYIVFGAELSNGADPSVTGGYLVSSVALFFACVVTCSISYDLEQTLRTQYLSDSRFLSITRNLQSQLEGLERSLLAASGKDNITLADLDSPLEKAMLAVRSLLLDGRLSRDQKNVLDLVMACLSSPNLLTPDLDRQVKRGEVEMDVEVEKWLFNEVARRKRLTSDPDEVGQVQLTPPNDDEDDDDEGGDGLEVNSLPGKMIATAAEPCDASIASVADAANGAIVVGGPRRRSASSTALVPTLVFEAGSISGLYTARTVTYLNRLDEFNFPIFEFAKECGAHPLLIMSHRLCVGSGLVGRLGLNADKFVSCMATIELGYHSDLAFHNSLHAADVLHCINYFLNLPTVGTLFSDLEQLSILLAATIHDFDHPGVNNHFLIASSDRRALLYNDKSVLENHHCASAFEVMSRKECAFLGSLDRADFKTVREAVVEMVLATDLAQHFSLLTMFKKKVLTAETFDPVGTREDRTLLMQMLMKCADVSNPTKAWPEYNEWILRITEEWFRQGDREKLLGLPVSPFCDRDGTTLTRPAPAQNSFINFIVYPLFDAFHAWTPLGEVKRGLEMNRAKWAAVIAAEKEEEARVAAAAAGIASPSSAKAKRRSGSLPTPPRPRRNRSFPALPGLTTGVATLEVGEEEEDEGTAGSVRRGSAAPPLSASIVLRRGEGLASAEKRWRRRSGPPGWLTLEEG